MPKASEKAKAKAGQSPKKMSFHDKYDETRRVGPDPRDPRTTGPPCFGNHEEAPGGRGSVTGSNGHAAWVGCLRCKLRLSYTPAYGATGLSRSPGPLPEDTNQVTTDLGVAAPYNPLLKNQAIGLIGAEKSLEARLENIRARKEAAGYQRQMPIKTEPKASQPPQLPEPAMSQALQAPPTYAGTVDVEELPSHVSRKTRKAALVDVPSSSDEWAAPTPPTPGKS